eukprot:5518688-Alexandrium_andersonii.AAC.1
MCIRDSLVEHTDDGDRQPAGRPVARQRPVARLGSPQPSDRLQDAAGRKVLAHLHVRPGMGA